MNKFVATFTDFASEITDAPIVFHNFMGYAVISTIVGRNVYFPFGDMNIYPNLYILFIASSSRFRKSTVLSIGANMLRRFNPNIILPSEFTQEKLLEILQASPVGTFIFYEFLSLMSLLNKDYNSGMKAFLTELYDCPPIYSRKIKSSEVAIEKPCVSLLAATTEAWFIDKIREGDIGGGFLSRFLFVPAFTKEKDLALPPPADDMKRNKLLIMLKDISEIKGEFKLAPEAEKLYKTWYIKQSAQIDRLSPLITGSMARLQIYVLKFAMLESIGQSKELVISEAAMLEALNYIDWIMKQTQNLIENEISFSKDGKLMIKLRKIIKSHNGTGIVRSDLLKKMDVQAKELDASLSTLFQRDEIEQINIAGETKPKIAYKWKMEVR